MDNAFGRESRVPLKDPEARRAYKATYYAAHREEKRARVAAYDAAHPGRQRNWQKLGWTPDMVALEFIRLDGECPICGILMDWEGPRKYRPHLDHDHISGEVRGLLCHMCNVGLGHFLDNPTTLRSAARYLEDPRSEIGNGITDGQRACGTLIP